MKNRQKRAWPLVRRFHHSVVASSFAVSLCLAQEPVLSLEDALALAKRQNTQVQITNLETTKATEEISQTKTQRLPVFKVYANVGESLTPINLTIPMGALGDFPATGPVPAQDANIKTARQITGFIYGTAGQPLLQLYKAGLGIKEARLGEETAREKARQQIEETTQQVKQNYYQLSQIQSQISSAQVSLKYLEELSVYTERNLEQETVLKSDMLNVKAKLSQQRYQLVTLTDNFATQKEALNHLMGRDLRTEFTIQPEPPPSEDELSLPVAQQKGLNQRPELRQARLQTKKAELDVRLERAEYIPDLSAQISYLSFPNLNFFPKNIVTAGLTLEWQPFDWGQKKHKLAELRESAKQASLTEHDAEQQILLDVNGSFRKLAEARALLAVAAASQEVEREKLRVVMNRYKEKSALLTDVLNQQSALAQADTQYALDLASFWTAKANFDHALGEQ